MDRRCRRRGRGGGIPWILLAQKPPSFAKGTKLHLLEWVSFVPAADVELKRLAAEFGQLAGVDVTVELINFNGLNPRIASGIETKAGPDIIQMHNGASIYFVGKRQFPDGRRRRGRTARRACRTLCWRSMHVGPFPQC